MSLFSRLRNWHQARDSRKPAPAPLPGPEFRAIFGQELWWSAPESAGIAVTERTSLQSPAMLAALNVLATDVAVLPLRVYKRLPDGGRDEWPGHPVDELFSRSPDGETTPIRWRQAWMGHALQYGNGYAEIVRKGRGTPVALHLLDPELTHPKRTERGLGYEIPDGKWIPAANVLHLAGFGYDGLAGYNFTRLIRQGIGVSLAAEGYGADFFGNGAEPGGVLETPNRLSDQAIQHLRDGWDAKHRGQGNRFRPAVLEQGIAWKSTATDPEKAQLLETRRFQVLDTARPWRVPPHKIGDFSQAHLANIEASNLDYLMTALMCWLVSIEQECELKLFSTAEYRAGYYVEHNVNALLRGDITSRFHAYGKALMDGWLSRNEVRRRENLNPIPAEQGGDKYLVPVNLTTLENAGINPDPGLAPGQSAGSTPGASKP